MRPTVKQVAIVKDSCGGTDIFWTASCQRQYTTSLNRAQDEQREIGCPTVIAVARDATRMESDASNRRLCGGSDLGTRSGGSRSATEKSWIEILRTTRTAQTEWFVRAVSCVRDTRIHTNTSEE